MLQSEGMTEEQMLANQEFLEKLQLAAVVKKPDEQEEAPVESTNKLAKLLSKRTESADNDNNPKFLTEQWVFVSPAHPLSLS